MKLLEGIKIVDFTQAHAGSLCTMILADFGAEVIKIERPGVGDLARFWAPFKNDASGYYAYLNRYNHRYARAVDIDEDVRRIFDYYDWPGNVRELSNVIERGVITAPGSVISVQQLPESFFSIDNIDTRKRFVGGSLEEEIDSFTADLVRRTYESHPSSRKLAEALSISQTKANRLIARYITVKV